MTAAKLIDAVKAGDLAAVEALFDAGAEVDAQDEQGWTPLKWAAGRGDAEMVTLLLARGADLRLTGRDGRTPLSTARAASRHEVVSILEAAEKKLGAWEDPARNYPYCRAYYLRDLAPFADFPTATVAEAVRSADGADAEAEPVVYLHQDLTVTASMWHGEDVLFDAESPEWQRFCEEQLGFAIPSDLR